MIGRWKKLKSLNPSIVVCIKLKEKIAFLAYNKVSVSISYQGMFRYKTLFLNQIFHNCFTAVMPFWPPDCHTIACPLPFNLINYILLQPTICRQSISAVILTNVYHSSASNHYQFFTRMVLWLHFRASLNNDERLYRMYEHETDASIRSLNVFIISRTVGYYTELH